MGSTAEATNSLRGALIRGGVTEAGTLLLAFSGGPDSSALLLLLARQLSDRYERLTAAYFSHGIQPEEHQRAEEARARESCGILGVPLRVGGLPQGYLVDSPEARELGLEAAARRARYDYLLQAAEAEGATHLLTAHHRDDQVETILMRLLQGGGLSALGGIEEAREVRTPGGAAVTLLRPLIGVTREGLRGVLEEGAIDWHRDAGNTSQRFLRNRIRSRLIPVLREVMPSYQDSLLRLAQEAREVSQVHVEEGQRLPVEVSGTDITFSGREFWAASPAARREALFSAVNRVVPTVHRLPDRFLGPLWQRPSAGSLKGHGVEVSYDSRRIRLRPLVVRPDKKGYFSVVWESMLPSPVKLRILRSGADSGHADVECEGITPPLVLRTRRPGDRLDRFDGSIRLGRLLSIAGVPPDRRDMVPLLEDREGILALFPPTGEPEQFFSERCVVRPADQEIPDIEIDISADGIKVEYAKR